MANYSTMGLGFETKQEAMDKAMECCMPGGFMNCRTGWQPYGNCNALMATRCAKHWDEKCDIYLNSLVAYTSEKFEAKDFLDKTAAKKYCRAGHSVNGNCQEVCQRADPNDPDSPEVCGQVGMIGSYHVPAEEAKMGCPLLSPTYLKTCDSANVCSAGKRCGSGCRGEGCSGSQDGGETIVAGSS